MIPLRDDIPTETFPFVTVLLIAANCIVFLYQLSLGEAAAGFAALFGAVPAELVGAVKEIPTPPVAPLLTLGGNMMFLWIFGNNVEDSTGHVRFLIFYLLCGLAAAGAHTSFNPSSRLPMIGASGAVSGVLGAYFLLYPRARVLTLVLIGFFFQTILVPAAFFLGFWFFLQFLSGLSSLGSTGGGVAWFAHMGGFCAGLALLLLFKKRSVRLFSRRTGWVTGCSRSPPRRAGGGSAPLQGGEAGSALRKHRGRA